MLFPTAYAQGTAPEAQADMAGLIISVILFLIAIGATVAFRRPGRSGRGAWWWIAILWIAAVGFGLIWIV
ncbi:MAG: hypothetical protein M3Z21_16725 [Pseudomonadota bacterium]|nr:hypothetical protein [Pseudomonadota bacterium]